MTIKQKERHLFEVSRQVWSIRESNPLPFDCEPNALPNELIPHCYEKRAVVATLSLVEYIGVEPMTF